MEESILARVVHFLNGIVWSFPSKLPWMVAALLAAGVYVSFRLGFVQLRRVRHALRVLVGKYDSADAAGDITHFQALSTALSATVGIGNIAGVATAIHYGGPGALFWMWVTALFGMALKFAECTLSMRYRGFDADGRAAGGPMYYVEQGLGKRFKPLAILFAFCAIVSSFGAGNMNQANTVAVSARSSFGIDGWIVGLASAALVGVVILGGINRIARVSSKLAPAMAVIYVAGALAALLLNYDRIPAAFGMIFHDAFAPRASLGGSVAGVFSLTLLWGVKRGLFSNEAGQGSAPIAHAAARTDEPVREGAVAMLGPLIDTLIICTMTGLVIVVTGVWDQKRGTELPVGEVAVYEASALPAKAPSERARIAAADAALAAAADAGRSPADRQLRLAAGRAPGLVFAGNDGLIADAVVTAGGRPYEGPLTFAVARRQLVSAPPGEAFELRVRGDVLQNSSALTAWAFERGLSKLGGWGALIVTFSVFLFAISTMISWSYYGDRCVQYLLGARYVMGYRALYVLFVFVGSVSALEVVWAYGDLALGLMAVPNLIAVVLLTPQVVRMSRDYFGRMAARDRAEAAQSGGEERT